MGSYASLSVHMSVVRKKNTRKNSYVKSIVPRGVRFGQSMDVDDPKVDLKGQGDRSKVKVTRSKNVISGLF